MKLRSLISLIGAFVGCSLTLHALEFRLISWEGHVQDLKYSNGNTAIEIDASEGSLSSTFIFDGPGPLVFFRETVVDGKTVREPLATLDVPDNFTKAIILLAYADSTRTRYTGSWINDSPEARPPQTVTYKNLSSYPIAIKLGAATYAIPPRGTRMETTNAAVPRMIFKASAQTAAGWEAVISSVQPVRPGLRTLVLLRDGRPDPNTGIKETVDLLMFNDYPPPPAPTDVASR